MGELKRSQNVSAKDSSSNAFPRGPRTTEAIDQAIGRNISAIRKDKNLTPETVAEQLNVDLLIYRAFEDGSERVRAADLFRLASLFDVPIHCFYRDITN
jgi:DNA-binding transcriptional regulator YiaG